MNISLLTATGAYNLGDELILREEYEYLQDRYLEGYFTIFTDNSESSLLPKCSNIRYISYFPNHIKSRPFQNIVYLIQNILAIRSSDLIVIGGGGLIYDNESGQSFDRLLTKWKIRIWLADFFHKPIFYWSLGIHIRSENEAKIKSLFTGENISVSVRDTASRKTLENIGIKATLLPDPVLLYDPEVPKLLPKKRPKIGLSFRSGYLNDELENIEHIITFLQANGYEIILLNHSFHPDNRVSDDADFLKQLADKYSLTSTRSIEETLETYKELSMVVGMRLHSLILSFVHAIPFFVISYGKKTDEFIRSINYEYSLAARTFDIEVFKTQFLKLEGDKKAVEFALQAKNDTIKKEYSSILKKTFDGLESTRL